MVGIYLMGFVILVAGVGVLGTAIVYAVRPTEARLALLRPLSLAAIFGAICSMSVGAASALSSAAANATSPKWPEILLQGLSEACIPPFVAFGLLAVAWLLVTAGMRRQA
jgi:hypothetical protein